MKIFKIFFPILIIFTSSFSSAKPMTDAELNKLITLKSETTNLYLKHYIELRTTQNIEKPSIDILVQNVCNAIKPMSEIKVIATKYPQVPHDILESANTSYEIGMKILNQLRQETSKKIECIY